MARCFASAVQCVLEEAAAWAVDVAGEDVDGDGIAAGSAGAAAFELMVCVELAGAVCGGGVIESPKKSMLPQPASDSDAIATAKTVLIEFVSVAPILRPWMRGTP